MDWRRFGGNKRARIYGRLDCPSALAAIKRGRTYQQHRVFFADEASALAAGFRPCARCMREAYKKWRAANAARVAWFEQSEIRDKPRGTIPDFATSQPC
jgi:methylphosphotriester-DNA--protein-cysteine methyltransferase